VQAEAHAQAEAQVQAQRVSLLDRPNLESSRDLRRALKLKSAQAQAQAERLPLARVSQPQQGGRCHRAWSSAGQLTRLRLEQRTSLPLSLSQAPRQRWGAQGRLRWECQAGGSSSLSPFPFPGGRLRG